MLQDQRVTKTWQSFLVVLKKSSMYLKKWEKDLLLEEKDSDMFIFADNKKTNVLFVFIFNVSFCLLLYKPGNEQVDLPLIFTLWLWINFTFQYSLD